MKAVSSVIRHLDQARKPGQKRLRMKFSSLEKKKTSVQTMKAALLITVQAHLPSHQLKPSNRRYSRSFINPRYYCETPTRRCSSGGGRSYLCGHSDVIRAVQKSRSTFFYSLNPPVLCSRQAHTHTARNTQTESRRPCVVQRSTQQSQSTICLNVERLTEKKNYPFSSGLFTGRPPVIQIKQRLQSMRDSNVPVDYPIFVVVPAGPLGCMFSRVPRK